MVISGDRDYDNRHYYVFHFSKNVNPKAFSDDLGFKYEKALENLEDHYLFSVSKDFLEEEIERKILAYFSSSEDGIVNSFQDNVLFYQKQYLKRRYRKTPPVNYEDSLNFDQTSNRITQLEQIKETLNIRDPMFPDQWHLYNLEDKFNDINVTGVWKQGITGKNVTVAIIDDGIDMTSEDLRDNYYAQGSYDFNDHNPVPMPKLPEDMHGTRCAGELAAVRNNVCGIGVAYESKVSGLRILSGPITDIDEAESLNYDFHGNHIYSCSWGPDDDGKTVDGPSPLVLRAFINGVNNGRNGLGSVYVFASGNGGIYDDNCNFDGYANSVFTITIGGIDKHGKRFAYSEACSSQLAVTYAGGSAGYIYTTDVGTSKCTSKHGGTSAAAPLAAGILALVLSIRQALVVKSAVPINLQEYGWEKTYSGRFYNEFYGYGKLDTYAIIEQAKKFKHLRPQARFSSRKETVNKIFSKNNGTITSTILVDSKSTKSANLGTLEHLIVNVNIVHSKRGDLEVYVVSPNGVASRLASRRVYDFNSVGILNWNFMSVKHWGESFLGNWTIRVSDKNNPNVDGSFIDWQLHLWGEAIDSKKAKPVPYPIVYTSNKTSTFTQTSISTITSIFKPTTTSSSISTSKTTSEPATKTSTSESMSPTGTIEHPTTDKTKTQKGSFFGRKAGLYLVLIFLILVFILFLCYIYFRRRSRIKQSLIEESYEFEVLRDDEEDINYLFQDSEKAKILQENPEIYTAFDIHDDFDSTSTSFRRE
ncbi:hypothetical protein PMAC_000929 [Pneumocystis sp. 'macacae']|nr:hypothetical protein PMAC_000929 [Pneumocystis sp. 'macacae']